MSKQEQSMVQRFRSTLGAKLALCAGCVWVLGSAPGAAGAATPSAAVPVPTPVPVEAFFKPTELSGAKLSPSGRYLAAKRGGVTERVGFLIMDLEGKEGSHFVSASPRDDVAWFQWVGDDWLVFGVQDANYRGGGAIGAGLMSMSRDGKTSRQLIARDWNKKAEDVQRRQVLSPAHTYWGSGAPDSLEVMVAQAHYGQTFESAYEYSTLHALNIVTGQLRSVDAPRADAWIFDGRGQPRVSSRTVKGERTISWWNPKTQQWQELLTAPELQMPWTPVAIRDEHRLLVRTVSAEGYLELRDFDAVQGQLSHQPFITTPGFSSAFNAHLERTSNRLVALDLLVDGWTTVWTDPAGKALQAKVDARLPGRKNTLDCGDCVAPKRVVVESHSDTDPGLTLLYMPETEQLQLVGKARPDIAPERMARMELHRPKARDGEDLPIWITRSPDLPASKPAPAVLLLHGGPWSRGTYWGWHDEAQFLASRGYLVIEPEFRGSTGYGVLHFKRGFKQWGLSMQDDVTDALKFAVDRGWVDPKRVCLMGASYGGYATLMGLVKDPDQYRCGIAFAAVSDPRHMFDFFWSDISAETKIYGLTERLGDRQKDEARFIATSPVEQAARIQAPLLLVHGGEDRRVPIQNAERMRDALQKAGKPVEWLVYPRARHGFSLAADELDYYRNVERFLGQHLQ